MKETGTGAWPRLEVYQDKRHRKVGDREVAKSKVDWATQELILDWIFTVARYSTVHRDVGDREEDRIVKGSLTWAGSTPRGETETRTKVRRKLAQELTYSTVFLEVDQSERYRSVGET